MENEIKDELMNEGFEVIELDESEDNGVGSIALGAAIGIGATLLVGGTVKFVKDKVVPLVKNKIKKKNIEEEKIEEIVDEDFLDEEN